MLMKLAVTVITFTVNISKLHGYIYTLTVKVMTATVSIGPH